MLIGDQARCEGTDDHPGDQVAKNDRLAKALRQQPSGKGRRHGDHQVQNKFQIFHSDYSSRLQCERQNSYTISTIGGGAAEPVVQHQRFGKMGAYRVTGARGVPAAGSAGWMDGVNAPGSWPAGVRGRTVRICAVAVAPAARPAEVVVKPKTMLTRIIATRLISSAGRPPGPRISWGKAQLG